jgi:superoxide dismutase, Fe-Mn family
VHNATVLHELYFDGIGEAPIPPSGLLAQAMARDYGSMDRWTAEFAACGRSLDAGAGWVIMAYSARDKRISTFVATDDSMTPAGALPLLAMDMAEHAYGPDHGKDVAKYVDAFMAAIKWTNAERLYREAMRV